MTVIKPIVRMSIYTNNPAFYDDEGKHAPTQEVARLLRRYADVIEEMDELPVDSLTQDGVPIRDVNGDRCGVIQIS